MAGVKVKPSADYVIAAEPVVLVDPTTGAPYSATGGGGGTEYTEDAAAPSNPAAPGRSLRRRDAPSAETSADGDWVTQNGTNKGEAYVKDLDATGHLATIAANTAAAEYEVVEASQTDQMCGTTGAAGDALNGLLIIPLTTSPGEVSIEDGSTNTVVFAGGATSVSTLIPFFVDLQGIKTVNGGWEITTGADVRVIAFGNFT